MSPAVSASFAQLTGPPWCAECPLGPAAGEDGSITAQEMPQMSSALSWSEASYRGIAVMAMTLTFCILSCNSLRCSKKPSFSWLAAAADSVCLRACTHSSLYAPHASQQRQPGTGPAGCVPGSAGTRAECMPCARLLPGQPGRRQLHPCPPHCSSNDPSACAAG